MPDETDNKIELSSTQTRLWILLGVASVLLLMVQGFFTYVVTTAGNEMRGITTEVRETNRSLVEVNATIRVQQTQLGYLEKQVTELQTSKKEAGEVHKVHDTRLNAVEQRLALHDQWIQAHHHP